MSYTKQTWQNGDVITAQKLNHMEDGIGGGNYDAVFEYSLIEDVKKLTGHGISKEEIVSMVENNINPKILIIYYNESDQTRLIGEASSVIVRYVDGQYGGLEFVGNTNLDVSVSLDGINGDGIAYCHSDNFSYTYNSTTKEYEFGKL